MKVVAFNGSPRRDGNTYTLLTKVLDPIQAAGIETEIVQIGGQLVHGCAACLTCRTKTPGRCVFEDDFVNDCADKCRQADAIIIGTPTYYSDVSTEVKAFIDRVGYVLGPEGALKHKPGCAVAAVRRGGATHAIDTINHFFMLNNMYIVCGTYWNMGYGRNKGECLNDAEGLKNMLALGENMVWILEKIGK